MWKQRQALVQEAAHPDANIIFGATFDENMDDEIRVTVIATRFDDKPSSMPAKESKPGLFTEAAEKKEAAAETPAPSGDQSGSKDDPFDEIFKIFNSK